VSVSCRRLVSKKQQSSKGLCLFFITGRKKRSFPRARFCGLCTSDESRLWCDMCRVDRECSIGGTEFVSLIYWFFLHRLGLAAWMREPAARGKGSGFLTEIQTTHATDFYSVCLRVPRAAATMSSGRPFFSFLADGRKTKQKSFKTIDKNIVGHAIQTCIFGNTPVALLM